MNRCYMFLLPVTKEKKKREIIKFKERYECCLCETKKWCFKFKVSGFYEARNAANTNKNFDTIKAINRTRTI